MRRIVVSTLCISTLGLLACGSQEQGANDVQHTAPKVTTLNVRDKAHYNQLLDVMINSVGHVTARMVTIRKIEVANAGVGRVEVPSNSILTATADLDAGAAVNALEMRSSSGFKFVPSHSAVPPLNTQAIKYDCESKQLKVDMGLLSGPASLALTYFTHQKFGRGLAACASLKNRQGNGNSVAVVAGLFDQLKDQMKDPSFQMSGATLRNLTVIIPSKSGKSRMEILAENGAGFDIHLQLTGTLGQLKLKKFTMDLDRDSWNVRKGGKVMLSAFLQKVEVVPGPRGRPVFEVSYRQNMTQLPHVSRLLLTENKGLVALSHENSVPAGSIITDEIVSAINLVLASIEKFDTAIPGVSFKKVAGI